MYVLCFMKVNFIIIGSQKSGTTSLVTQLSYHPRISFSRRKEPHFFSKNKDWKQSLSEYHSLFSSSDTQLYGEASTTYSFFPEFGNTAIQVHDYNPEIKIIYIMRQPVERIISHFVHSQLKGSKLSKPAQTILSDPRYVNRSRYWMQIKLYLDQFPQKQILLLIFEEFIVNPIATLSKVSSFLGIDSSEFPDQIDINAQNVSSKKIKKSRLGKWLTQSGFSQFAHNNFNERVLNIGSRLITQNLDKQFEFSLSLKKTLWTLLEEDVRNIRSLMDRRLRIWEDEYTS